MAIESSSRDERLQEILAAYLQNVENGHNPDCEKLLAQHLDLADDLRSFLNENDKMHRLVDEAVTVGQDESTYAPAVDTKVRYFGDYELLEEIARGGMGVVYKARQVSLNRIVALKMILRGELATPTDVQRFQMEAEAAANLDHPNIVPIYEVGEHQGQHFFSMKFIEGGSLAAKGPRADGHVASQQVQTKAARLVATVARAVHHAHQRGILHRDLKPANILLDAAGEPHVTDFGLAKYVATDSGMTQSGAIVGTPSYMSPEQARADKQLATSIDVYSLGGVLYQQLTGRPPFQGATPMDTLLQVLEREPVHPRSVCSRIDRDLETICLKCLHKEPGRRYESAAALADDLDRWLNGEPIVARSAGHLERVVKWVKRRPLLATVLLLVAVGFPLVTWKWREAQSNEQKATAELRRAETALYTNRVGRAHALYKDNDLSRARRLLEECPVELRGWEWNYVNRLCHDSLLTMKVSGDSTSSQPQSELPLLGQVCGVAFSPDGRLLAVASKLRRNDKSFADDWGEVHVWDVCTGREAVLLHGHKGPISCGLAFSPDGKLLASTGGPIPRVATVQRAYVWDVATGREVYSVPERSDNWGVFEAVAFSPDGRHLAVSGTLFIQNSSYQIILCDARTGKAIRTLEGGKSARATPQPGGLSFSPDGRFVASIGTGTGINNQWGPLTIWDVDAGRPHIAATPPSGPNARTYRTQKDIGGVAYSPDGRRLLTWGSPLVRIWDAATGAELSTLAGQDVGNAAWSPDGRRIAVGSGDGSVKVFDADTAVELFALRGHTGYVAFSPDGSLIVSGDNFLGHDHAVRLWDATRGQEVHTLNVGSGTYRTDGFALSSDGTLIGFAFGTGKIPNYSTPVPLTVKVCAVDTGRDILTLTGLGTLHHPSLAKMAFSPDGKRLAVVPGHSGKARHWDLATGREGVALEAAQNIDAVIFSPDGNTLALQAHSKLSLRDLSDGRETLSASGLVAFSPDGSLLGFLARGEEVRLLESGSGKVVRRLKWDGSVDGSLAFSADGRRVLLGDSDRGCIIVWDAASGQLLHAHTRFTTGLTGMRGKAAFSPDGSRLATAIFTRSAVEVALWDTATGQEVFTFKSPCRLAWSRVLALAWSADGSTLALADEFGDLRLWSAAPRTKEIQEARRAAWSDYALNWHRREAQQNEQAGQWFAAAFHLRQLIAAQPGDVEQWRQRLKRCEDKLREP